MSTTMLRCHGCFVVWCGWYHIVLHDSFVNYKLFVKLNVLGGLVCRNKINVLMFLDIKPCSSSFELNK